MGSDSYVWTQATQWAVWKLRIMNPKKKSEKRKVLFYSGHLIKRPCWTSPTIIIYKFLSTLKSSLTHNHPSTKAFKHIQLTHTHTYTRTHILTHIETYETFLIGQIWISEGAFLQWTVPYSNGFLVVWGLQTTLPSDPSWCLLKKRTKEKLIQQFPWVPLETRQPFPSHGLFCHCALFTLAAATLLLLFTLLWAIIEDAGKNIWAGY